MKELKMILAGFLLILTGISFLFLLAIPNASLILGPASLPTPEAIALSQLSQQDYLNTLNFIHAVEVISALLIIGGLVLSAFGTFHRES